MADHRPQTIAYPAPEARPRSRGLEPLAPHVIVLFGATGDLAKRKLIPAWPTSRSPRSRRTSGSSARPWTS